MAEQSEALTIGILHGPNLNLLGTREPEVYGTSTLAEIEERIATAASKLGAGIETYQSNGEGALVDWVQSMAGRADGMLVNAGGYTHTSIALADALRAVSLPYVEVHMSNIHGREAFRSRSVLAADAVGVVAGFGMESYLLALRGLMAYLRR